jgi:hypothetical protein
MNSPSASIITNLLEKGQTVSDCSIRFAFPTPEPRHSTSRLQTSRKFSPFAFPCWSWDLRATKAKSHAQHANAHPINAWSCQICNQHRAPSPARGSGFKSDTTRADHARTGITAVRTS